MAPRGSDSVGRRPVSVVFVCLGNICRSPMAEGVFQHLTKTTRPQHPLISHIDSAGTGAYHVGDDPDSRTMSTLADNGITGYRHHARKFQPSDFKTFDYVMAMDDDNLDFLQRMRNKLVKDGNPDGELAKLRLFGDFGGRKGEEVADPYYGGKDGFTIAYEQMVRFTKGFLKRLEVENVDDEK
ncbi:phosphotyrosine protein phosphatases I [Pseudovirgaria hyperparasitica]|uniref:Phosphotyrosine protein phosphatases I n=1 Tax=Pseudovirgaria hyperparasitica TaxID=470096 RepID=A0A6A6VT24_9PEZI|nr:phosphotyrosine protein phosphatases I [Pseudovirgaria hyperparasitica]KAF2753373.1 phosphotyrosine protein phosphatases I [Pseudovirgaria hyperparasitica]